MSEEQLRTWMIGGLEGDSSSQNALLRAISPLLKAFYGRRMRDLSEVEDLVQETLIAIHTRRAAYDRNRPFTSWMFAIARYKMIDHFRRTSRFQPLDGLEDLLVSESFEESSNAKLDIEQLLQKVSHKQARAIRDTHIDGLSVAEAARKVGISESDVKVSVHRGLKSLATMMKDN